MNPFHATREELDRMRPIYRDYADKHFLPSMVNDTENDEALIEVCKKLMSANGIKNENEIDEDIWLEFAYRAQELIEIQQNGYAYRWQAEKFDKVEGRKGL